MVPLTHLTGITQTTGIALNRTTCVVLITVIQLRVITSYHVQRLTTPALSTTVVSYASIAYDHRTIGNRASTAITPLGLATRDVFVGRTIRAISGDVNPHRKIKGASLRVSVGNLLGTTSHDGELVDKNGYDRLTSTTSLRGDRDTLTEDNGILIADEVGTPVPNVTEVRYTT